MSLINTRAINLLERSLDAASLRQKVIANNVANIDTKGFKRSEVSFEETLHEALSGETLSGRITNERHIPIGTPSLQNVRPSVLTDKSSSMRLDGNNVDIDVEMARMATNQLQYNALIQRINGKLSSLKYAISEGKR